MMGHPSLVSLVIALVMMIFDILLMMGDVGSGEDPSRKRSKSEQRTTQVRRAQVKFQRNKKGDPTRTPAWDPVSSPHPHPSTSTYLPQPSSLNLNLCLPRPRLNQAQSQSSQAYSATGNNQPPLWERSTPTSTSPLLSFLVSLEVVVSYYPLITSHTLPCCDVRAKK